MMRTLRWAVAVSCALLLALAPLDAMAVFPGERGKIVFVSGMGGPANDDSGADVYILSAPNGSVVPLDTRPGQHRHPNWSPDLRKVAYALWDGANNEKIWVHDLVSGATDRLGPHASNVRDDRPAFDRAGKRIAYESEVTDGSGQLDILIANITNGATGAAVLNLTDTPNLTEGKPVWSPDGKWVYFSRRPAAGGDDGIYRKRANGSGDAIVVIDTATAEYQASLSPDGRRMCYTRGPFGSTDADVYVLDFDEGGIGYDLSDTNLGAYNCAWSPDGRYVAYVRGVFTNGALMYELADDSGAAMLLTTDTPNHFDGNPDWAPRNPAFCKGKPITIAGTSGPDVITGTGARDVVHAFGGKDTIRVKGGNDLVCAGGGNDRVWGGPGNDVLYGEKGDDRLDGDGGRDTCVGGPGVDVVIECE